MEFRNKTFQKDSRLINPYGYSNNHSLVFLFINFENLHMGPALTFDYLHQNSDSFRT